MPTTDRLMEQLGYFEAADNIFPKSHFFSMHFHNISLDPILSIWQ